MMLPGQNREYDKALFDAFLLNGSSLPIQYQYGGPEGFRSFYYTPILVDGFEVLVPDAVSISRGIAGDGSLQCTMRINLGIREQLILCCFALGSSKPDRYTVGIFENVDAEYEYIVGTFRCDVERDGSREEISVSLPENITVGQLWEVIELFDCNVSRLMHFTGLTRYTRFFWEFLQRDDWCGTQSEMMNALCDYLESSERFSAAVLSQS